jgi:hypothetical protein
MGLAGLTMADICVTNLAECRRPLLHAGGHRRAIGLPTRRRQVKEAAEHTGRPQLLTEMEEPCRDSRSLAGLFGPPSDRRNLGGWGRQPEANT